MDNVAKIIIVSIICLVAAALLIQSTPQIDETQRRTELLREVNRLKALASEDNLTSSDVLRLQPLLSGKTSEEFAELVWMADHNFQHHSLHSLQALYWIEVGRDYSCPADILSHASAYLEFNDTERARHAIERGEMKLLVWEPKARAEKAKDPTVYPGLDEIVNAMKLEIAAMQRNDLDGVKYYANYLEENGYC